jgi:hypothetical protein
MNISLAVSTCPGVVAVRSQYRTSSLPIMRDVVTDTSNLVDKSFDLAQHSVDADGELVERVGAAGRQALTQIACDDALDSPVDLREPVMRAQAQHHADSDREPKRRQQAQRQGPLDDFCDLVDLVDSRPITRTSPLRSGCATAPTFCVSPGGQGRWLQFRQIPLITFNYRN